MKRTQRKIAIKVGISDAFLSQILHGKSRPSWTVAKRLASATQTSPVLWLEGSIEEMRAVFKKDT